MVSLLRREQFVSTLVRISYLTFNYSTIELLITKFCLFAENGRTVIVYRSANP